MKKIKVFEFSVGDMTATQRFIDDAITSGYLSDYGGITPKSFLMKKILHSSLLDPLAWQAVGKTRGWSMVDEWAGTDHESWVEGWTIKQNNFIYELQKGKSIEDALTAIEI